jgi:hypothetical protein
MKKMNTRVETIERDMQKLKKGQTPTSNFSRYPSSSYLGRGQGRETSNQNKPVVQNPLTDVKPVPKKDDLNEARPSHQGQ